MSIQRVFIHVGPPKTGTTTIQAFMKRAVPDLRTLGVRYTNAGQVPAGRTFNVKRPSGWTRIHGPGIAQHLLPWTLLGEVEGLTAESCWMELVAELRQAREATAVISSEAFCRIGSGHIEEICKYLCDYEVRVICYLRTPFSKLLSDYAQRIRTGNYHATFERFIAEHMALVQDFDGFIASWDAAFGSDNVFIRDFDAAVHAGSLELDFAACFVRDVSKLAPALGAKRLNVSPSPQALARMRLVNRIEWACGRPRATRRLFSGLRRMATAHLPGSISSPFGGSPQLFSPDDQARIEAVSASSYNALAQRARQQAIRDADRLHD